MRKWKLPMESDWKRISHLSKAGVLCSILSSQQIPTQLGVDTTSAQESTLDWQALLNSSSLWKALGWGPHRQAGLETFQAILSAACMLSRLSRVRLFVTPWLLCPWNSPGKNTGVGSHACLQGIFLTQGLSLRLTFSPFAGRFFTYWSATYWRIKESQHMIGLRGRTRWRALERFRW